MTRIIGIDPGLVKTGWGILDYKGNTLKFVACGTIRSNTRNSLPVRLLELSQKLDTIIKQYSPDQSAIEETFVNKNAMSSLKLGHARGCLLLTLSQHNLPIFEYAATLVKKSVTGVGRAEKSQIQMMVKQLMPTANIDSEDASDALAIAICHSSHASLCYA